MLAIKSSAPFNRVTGLLIVEVRNSNPNGDPDMESDPRTLEADGRGIISPVSFKRKLRDLVSWKDGPAWQEWARHFEWPKSDDWTDEEGYSYEILETRGRKREEIFALEADPFKRRYWDARVFGNTFLESIKDAKEQEGQNDSNAGGDQGKAEPKKKTKTKDQKRDVSHFISTGAVQVGVGVSVCRVDIDRMTQTNKAGVEESKDRGMAPLGFRLVRHGLYSIPFFVNPTIAVRTGMRDRDINLLRFLLPHSYRHTASATRPFVSVLHAWWIEHNNPLGSCPDALLIDALTPRRKGGGLEPSTSLDHYEPIPKELPQDLRARVESIQDVVAAPVPA